MSESSIPKAILFDIGGVCVLSPFQAILSYELGNNIPPGYINFAIQRGPSATGAWQLIERGAVPLDDAWFEAFQAQLSRPEIWRAFLAQQVQSPASRTAKSHCEDNEDRSGQSPVPSIDAKTLFWRMMRISRTPDPWIFPALQRLRELKTKDGRNAFIIGALSNTIAFPDGIQDDEGVPFSSQLLIQPDSKTLGTQSTNIADSFDVFVSSAHAGVRKPDRKAYELALDELSRVSVMRGMGELRPGDVLFLDDIGANLKGARMLGIRTIKVGLGRTREAVGELERVTGLRLVDGEKSKL